MLKKIAVIMSLSLAFTIFPIMASAAEGPQTPDAANDPGAVQIITPDNCENGSPVNTSKKTDVAGTHAKAGKNGAAKKGASVDPLKYSYTITPLLPPFNDYFFVKTDNPDPTSFRFEDKSSKYDDDITDAVAYISPESTRFTDIKYDDPKTRRISGGYIFRGWYTDGGEIILQKKKKTTLGYEWTDTDVHLTLPVLKTDLDYLIDTYAVKDNFFDNMDAVQAGFDKICLYSSSYIRGKLVRVYDYWEASHSPHVDQVFYIHSPYTRKDSKELFASSIYPFFYDSKGFPKMMADVAKALDSSARCYWDENKHYLINVTYNGETRSYGGAGNVKGQGVSEDKILKFFTFGDGSEELTLDGSRSLLRQYAAIDMEDDVPREDALTWKNLWDAAGDGTWIRITRREGDPFYAYIAQGGDGTYFNAEEFGTGNSRYIRGNLDYAHDIWVDGRYVGLYEVWEKGATFEEHPTSKVLVRDVIVPQISFSLRNEYNSETNKYEPHYTVKDITEEVKDKVVLTYSDGMWYLNSGAYNDGSAVGIDIREMVNSGVLDQKYLDMIIFTEEEVRAFKPDRNTNIVPSKGLVYDGSAAPGTVYDEAAGHCWNKGKVTKQPTCTEQGVKTITCLVCGETKTEMTPPVGHTMIKNKAKAPTCTEEGYSAYWYCKACKKYFSDAEGQNEIEYGSWWLPSTGHTWNDGEVEIEPTFEDPGLMKYTCINCGETRTEEIEQLEVQDGYEFTSEDGFTYTVISAYDWTVALTKAPDFVPEDPDTGDPVSSTVIKIPLNVEFAGVPYEITEIGPEAFRGTMATTVIIPKHIERIRKNAFAGSPVTKLIVKTTDLRKKTVKDSLLGSSVKLIKVKIRWERKWYVKKYKKIFRKNNSGLKVKVK